MSQPGLVAACDDPQLFGLSLWPTQRVLLSDVEAGPRLHVWALGRRSGKTTMAALAGLWDCLLRPQLAALLQQGERRHAVAIATNLRQARRIVLTALTVVERSPLLAELVENVTEDEISFLNGRAFTAFPCSSRGARGWPISTIIMDEAAHFLSETDGPAVAERVFEALVPSTAQFGDEARVIVSSTPWGVGNLFAELFQRANSSELEDAVAHHATTAQANPTISPEFLAKEQARDSEAFRSEYEAQFLAGGASFLDGERIRDAIADRGEILPESVWRTSPGWVAGLDPAFSRDPFAVCIVGRDVTTQGRLVLGAARRWIPSKSGGPKSFEERRSIEDEVLAEVAQFVLRYTRRAVTDQHLAPAVKAALQRHGLFVTVKPMTAQTKSDAFMELRARIQMGSLELYEEPHLIAELRRLRTRYASGRASVVNPRAGDSHGDLAQALALATYELRNVRTPSDELPDLVPDPSARLTDFRLGMSA